VPDATPIPVPARGRASAEVTGKAGKAGRAGRTCPRRTCPGMPPAGPGPPGRAAATGRPPAGGPPQDEFTHQRKGPPKTRRSFSHIRELGPTDGRTCRCAARWGSGRHGDFRGAPWGWLPGAPPVRPETVLGSFGRDEASAAWLCPRLRDAAGSFRRHEDRATSAPRARRQARNGARSRARTASTMRVRRPAATSGDQHGNIGGPAGAIASPGGGEKNRPGRNRSSRPSPSGGKLVAEAIAKYSPVPPHCHLLDEDFFRGFCPIAPGTGRTADRPGPRGVLPLPVDSRAIARQGPDAGVGPRAACL
jgi:hypothetical protein